MNFIVVARTNPISKPWPAAAVTFGRVGLTGAGPGTIEPTKLERAWKTGPDSARARRSCAAKGTSKRYVRSNAKVA